MYYTLEDFQEVLGTEMYVDMEKLREMAEEGVPDVVRVEVWKYLLGVARPDKSEEETTQRQQNEEYSYRGLGGGRGLERLEEEEEGLTLSELAELRRRRRGLGFGDGMDHHSQTTNPYDDMGSSAGRAFMGGDAGTEIMKRIAGELKRFTPVGEHHAYFKDPGVRGMMERVLATYMSGVNHVQYSPGLINMCGVLTFAVREHYLKYSHRKGVGSGDSIEKGGLNGSVGVGDVDGGENGSGGAGGGDLGSTSSGGGHGEQHSAGGGEYHQGGGSEDGGGVSESGTGAASNAMNTSTSSAGTLGTGHDGHSSMAHAMKGNPSSINEEHEHGEEHAEEADPEADLYYLFTALLNIHLRDWFSPETTNRQMTNLMTYFRALMPDLYNHFEEEELEPNEWALNWLHYLLSRSLPLECTLRLWDKYFGLLVDTGGTTKGYVNGVDDSLTSPGGSIIGTSSVGGTTLTSGTKSFDSHYDAENTSVMQPEQPCGGMREFHTFVCLAVLNCYKDMLEELEYSELKGFMQRLPMMDMDQILAQAYNIQEEMVSQNLV
eukprot:Nk52_evm9s148 gene=Nk52_evmTU9s148